MSDKDNEVVIADYVEIDMCENCGSPRILGFDAVGELVTFICLPVGATELGEQLIAADAGTLVDFEPEEPRLTEDTPCAGKA